jgi:hypothetical protein
MKIKCREQRLTSKKLKIEYKGCASKVKPHIDWQGVKGRFLDLAQDKLFHR